MNEVLHQLNPELGKEKFHVIGRAFLGVMHKDKKSPSYTSTLWLVFCYLPILPYNTYRVFSDEGRARILPRVFGLDEFILYRSVEIEFSWRQVLMTMFTVWGGIGALLIVFFFTYLEFGSMALLELLLGVVIAALGVILVQDLMNVRFHKSKTAIQPAPSSPPAVIPEPVKTEAKIDKQMEQVDQEMPPMAPPIIQLERSAPAPTVVSKPVIEKQQKAPGPMIELKPVKSTITVDLEAEHVPQKALDLDGITGTGGLLPRKFDPNKVLMPDTMIDMDFVEDMKYSTPMFRTAGILAVINLIILGVDIMLDLYFTLEQQVGFPQDVQKVYLLISKYHLFDFTGIILAIIMFLSRHFIVPYALALLAIISLLGMHIELFNYFKVQ